MMVTTCTEPTAPGDPPTVALVVWGGDELLRGVNVPPSDCRSAPGCVVGPRLHGQSRRHAGGARHWTAVASSFPCPSPAHEQGVSDNRDGTQHGWPTRRVPSTTRQPPQRGWARAHEGTRCVAGIPDAPAPL